MKTFITATLVAAFASGYAGASVPSGAGTAPAVTDAAAPTFVIEARRGRGKDDPAGHIRGGHGADDPAGHASAIGFAPSAAQPLLIEARRGRGKDDPAGHIRGGHGADDPIGHG